jgi:hypothetical protein
MSPPSRDRAGLAAAVVAALAGQAGGEAAAVDTSTGEIID